MNEDKQKRLVRQYPSVFKLITKDIDREMPPPIAIYGITAPDGWYHIIDAAAERLSQLDGHIYAVQVKEKFGGLRFYYDGTDVSEEGAVRASEITRMAEEISVRTCQQCGAPGEHGVDGGWAETLCDECRADSPRDA